MNFDLDTSFVKFEKKFNNINPGANYITDPAIGIPAIITKLHQLRRAYPRYYCGNNGQESVVLKFVRALKYSRKYPNISSEANIIRVPRSVYPSSFGSIEREVTTRKYIQVGEDIRSTYIMVPPKSLMNVRPIATVKPFEQSKPEVDEHASLKNTVRYALLSEYLVFLLQKRIGEYHTVVFTFEPRMWREDLPNVMIYESRRIPIERLTPESEEWDTKIEDMDKYFLAQRKKRGDENIHWYFYSSGADIPPNMQVVFSTYPMKAADVTMLLAREKALDLSCKG